MRASILMFFSAVATAHDEAWLVLVASKTLLPSIILMLNQLTTPIFEENEAVMLSPTKTMSYVHIPTWTGIIAIDAFKGGGETDDCFYIAVRSD
jgi:hypothetical protein